jgi:hypothetical protein
MALKQLCYCLQLFALPAQAQFSYFPEVFFSIPLDKLIDFQDYSGRIHNYWKLSEEEKAGLTALNDFFIALERRSSNAILKL